MRFANLNIVICSIQGLLILPLLPIGISFLALFRTPSKTSMTSKPDTVSGVLSDAPNGRRGDMLKMMAPG